MLQSAKQLNAVTGSQMQTDGVMTFSQAMGIAQHHDAVTGTAKTHVDADYHLRLS